MARSTQGNIYVLYVALVAIMVGAFYIAACYSLAAIQDIKIKNALEAASLACANDISSIVVNDPYWGYVALTDHPPIGEDTLAEDNEPLPVTGINTIIGTVRQELILANQIGTNEAIEFAMEDVAAARQTQRRLEEEIREALLSPESQAKDFNGRLVQPLKKALAIYKKNTKDLESLSGFKLDKLEAQLGYIDNGSSTNCPLPDDSNLAKTTEQSGNNGNFNAFVDHPYNDQSFYFAGLGSQTALVDNKLFRHGDGEHMCSIVKLSVELSKASPEKTIKYANACAQPFYNEDKTKPPIMALYFPHGLPANLNTVRDLLTSRSLENKIPQLTAVGGDYPTDTNSRLMPSKDNPNVTVKQAFTRGYLDWVRAAHCKLKISSLVRNLDTRLNLSTNNYNEQDTSNASGISPSRTYLYGVSKEGELVVLKPAKTPFRNQITHDSQLYALAFNAINANQFNWTFKERNQVRYLGTINGGKHAGQPMPSIEFVKELMALSNSGDDAPVVDEATRFSSLAASRYDQSRLAIEFEISSPQQLSMAQGSGY